MMRRTTDVKERIQEFADKATEQLCKNKLLKFDDLSRFRQQRILNGILKDHPHINAYAVENAIAEEVERLCIDWGVEFDDLSLTLKDKVWKEAEQDEASSEADRADARREE